MSRLVFGTYDVPEPGLLDRFVARGGRALDVANVYRDGESARAVGRWLRGGADVAVYAKGCHPPHCAPALVRPEIDVARSLLGVDRLDVFLLHRDDPSLPVAAWADALQAQVAAGTIGGFACPIGRWTGCARCTARSTAGRCGRSATTSRSPTWFPRRGPIAWP